MQLSSGGVLIEVRDDGVGISANRLADMNWRLDHPPVVDVSISRHMGLYAVSRLAARHGIKVRLRPGTPQGLSALVWLPGHLAKKGPASPPGARLWAGDADLAAEARQDSAARRGTGRHRNDLPARDDNQSAPAGRAAPAGRPGTAWFAAKRPSGGPDKSPEEIAAGWQPPGSGARHTGPADTAAMARAASGSGGFAAAGEQPGQTTAGLPRRVPGARAFPGSDTPGNGFPAAAATATVASAPILSAPPDVPAASEGAQDTQHHEQAPPPRRSPEKARSRLSGFQLGSREAAQVSREAGPGEHAGEENGR
jgi:hypothetical protein